MRKCEQCCGGSYLLYLIKLWQSLSVWLNEVFHLVLGFILQSASALRSTVWAFNKKTNQPPPLINVKVQRGVHTHFTALWIGKLLFQYEVPNWNGRVNRNICLPWMISTSCLPQLFLTQMMKRLRISFWFLLPLCRFTTPEPHVYCAALSSLSLDFSQRDSPTGTSWLDYNITKPLLIKPDHSLRVGLEFCSHFLSPFFTASLGL